MKMIDYNFVALPKIYRFLSGNELKVFVTLFDQWSQMKNEDGWYYRSQKQLCEDIDLPLRTLQRTIKKLIEKGVIFTTTYNDGVKMATYNKANEYKINMEKVVEISEKKGVKMATYSEKKGVKSVKEGCQNGTPYKNKEKKNKNNINKTPVYCNVTIDTLQVPGVDTPNEDLINSFDDEDWIKYEVERSISSELPLGTIDTDKNIHADVDNIIQSDDVNNINSDELLIKSKDKMSTTDKFKVVDNNDDFFDSFIENETSGDTMDNNDLNKENEMSDERTSVMNAISKQSERQAKENESSGCVKENITSTLGHKNNASKEFQNIPVDKSKVVNEKNDTSKGLTPHPQIALHPLSPSAWDEDAIFGTGEPQTEEMDKLYTQDNKTQPEPQEYPQNETEIFHRIYKILEEALVITDVEPFKAKLQEALDLLKQIRPNANRNAFTRCCNDTINWFKNNNFDDLDMFFVASDFKRDVEQMKKRVA